MNTKIQALEAKKNEVLGAVEEKESKISELEAARLALEESLSQELAEYKTKLEMTERGLVITFLAEIFFDSGKNIIKDSAKPTINKVATVLKEKVPDSHVAVEGYTDNDPIRHSAWESNWELSSARALAVLHELININTVRPERLSAIGYGEYRPVKSNATPEGKQQNRRVEIVILPTKIEKVKDGGI
jgi:chemotaxis protein MotB